MALISTGPLLEWEVLTGRGVRVNKNTFEWGRLFERGHLLEGGG